MPRRKKKMVGFAKKLNVEAFCLSVKEETPLSVATGIKYQALSKINEKDQ